MKIFTESERRKIYELWHVKQPISRITKLTRASRSTVYRIVKCYERKGNNESILRKHVTPLDHSIPLE